MSKRSVAPQPLPAAAPPPPSIANPSVLTAGERARRNKFLAGLGGTILAGRTPFVRPSTANRALVGK